MNRRKLLYFLSTLPAASIAMERVFSLEASQKTCADHGGDESFERNVQSPSDRQLRIGIVGVMGVGLYHLDRVAQNLNYPCSTIAIATNMARLRWSHAEHALLISDHGFKPATISDAQLMARDRKSDISRLAYGLGVAFFLNGLHGITGTGVTSVVAEALGELGIFTIAITPSRRDVESVRSLQRLVDVVFEVPYGVLRGLCGDLRIFLNAIFRAAQCFSRVGHESFGDILAAAWLGLLPSGQFLLGITNKGTEFAEYRPTVLQPYRRRVARLMCVRCATSTSVRNCVLILIEPSFCFPLLPSIRFSFYRTTQTSLRNPCFNRICQPTYLWNAAHGYDFESGTSEAPPLVLR